METKKSNGWSGWIEWEGGSSCPVHPETKVFVNYGLGPVGPCRASKFYWGTKTNIFAYKIADPNDIESNEVIKTENGIGVKHDSDKVRPDLIFNSMSLALMAVAEVATFGAEKYEEDGWLQVPDGIKRYTAAMDRHRLLESQEDADEESGLKHQAHLAWNALARLELMLREEKVNGKFK